MHSVSGEGEHTPSEFEMDSQKLRGTNLKHEFTRMHSNAVTHLTPHTSEFLEWVGCLGWEVGAGLRAAAAPPRLFFTRQCSIGYKNCNVMLRIQRRFSKCSEFERRPLSTDSRIQSAESLECKIRSTKHNSCAPDFNTVRSTSSYLLLPAAPGS